MTESRTKELSTEEMQLPDFSIKDLEELYKHDLTIPDELFDSLLKNDRLVLIEDIKKLLQHAIDKFEIFDEEKVSLKNTFFVWHAVFLLREIEATEALPALLDFFKQDEDITGFYFGDGLIEFGWEIFYSLGNKNLRLIIDFSKNLPDDTILRTEIIETLRQVILYEPGRRSEVENYLKELLLHVTTIDIHEDFNIDEFAGDILETIGEFQFTNLYTDVKRLLDANEIPLLLTTTWKDFEKQYILQTNIIRWEKQPLHTRKEIYEEYILTQEEQDENFDDDSGSYEFGDLDEEDEFDELPEDFAGVLNNFVKDDSYIDFEDINTPYVKDHPDIGRNEPCPCGSGKKYKKCHGKS
ncbi:MAG TPA: SEC-C domain-containing protein [Segetibacter sp.]